MELNINSIISNFEEQILSLKSYSNSINQNIKEYEEIIDNLKNENEELKNKLIEKENELNNINKISMIQSLSKEITDKNNIINHLKTQLDKLKPKNNLLQVLPKPILPKPILEKPVIPKLVIQEDIFNVDNFEPIDGYELIKYKKTYYLVQEETNRVFSIIKNKVGKHIGNLKSGKMKLLNN